MSAGILSWLVCGLFAALTAASRALVVNYAAYLTLLELYCLERPQTPLQGRRARARALRELYRVATPLCACATVVWLLVALHRG